MKNDKLQTEDSFIDNLVSSFPELKEEILDDDYKGLIGLQIGCFKRFTQEAIDLNELDVLEKCFKFVNDNIDKVVFRVENSLYLSYLLKLEFGKNPKAEKLLPNKLKNLRISNSQSNKNPKLIKFLNENKD